MEIWEKVQNWLTSQGLDLLTVCLKTVIVAVIGILLIRLVSKLLKKVLEKSKLDKAAYGLITTLAKTVLYILLGLILASGLGIDVTGIVALASVATLALSLALQNMLANIIGGFTLLYTDPFSAGDFVEIAGQSGTVTEIGIAYTKLITADNKVISIPNNSVTAAEIINYSVTGTRRLSFTFSASYNADPQTVVAALLSAVEDERVLPDHEPFAALESYGDSAINYVLRVWVKSENYWDLHFDVMKRVGEAFKEKGIEMTYPHLNVHIDK